jgi:hypothetical protein
MPMLNTQAWGDASLQLDTVYGSLNTAYRLGVQDLDGQLDSSICQTDNDRYHAHIPSKTTDYLESLKDVPVKIIARGLLAIDIDFVTFKD